MKILKKLREARNLSPKELAKEIGVTASQIKAWENGSEEISNLYLKELAFYFECGANDLLNATEDNIQKILTNIPYLLVNKELEDGFWGHIGILVKNHSKSKWYPISVSAANRLYSSLSNIESENEWLLIETLNNRALLFNPLNVNRIWLLDDNADQPGDDWNIPMDGYTGQPTEFYVALLEYMDYQEQASAPERLSKYCDLFTDKYDLGEEELYKFLLDTHIYDVKGSKSSYWVSEEKLKMIIERIKLKDMPLLFDLSSDDFESYFPSKSLSLIDIPKLNQLGRSII